MFLLEAKIPQCLTTALPCHLLTYHWNYLTGTTIHMVDHILASNYLLLYVGESMPLIEASCNSFDRNTTEIPGKDEYF